jgi:PIN domain nuclease of toxin-antitoxin system
VKVILDTHTFLGLIQEEAKLSKVAKETFLNPDNQLFFSRVSYWEICIKQNLGKLELAKHWQRVIENELLENGVTWLDIEKVHCEGILKLPTHHRDLFDRLLIAQAQVESMAILTVDETIQKYKVKTIW